MDTGRRVLRVDLGFFLRIRVAGTVAVTVADASTVAFGLVAVISAVSVTCSASLLGLGASTATRNLKTWPLASLLSLQVLVWPLGHTAKWGIAAVGLVVRVTVTSPASAP